MARNVSSVPAGAFGPPVGVADRVVRVGLQALFNGRCTVSLSALQPTP